MVDQRAILLDRATDPAQLLRRPGVYVAPSSSPAYGLVNALRIAGQVTDLGETQLEDGRHARAIRVSGSRSNVGLAITIGPDFYDAAKRDYANWKEKWWREAIQNAVDAGAKRILCEVEYLDDEGRPTSSAGHYASVVITVEDDGRGMDRTVLLEKFLMLGGTGKRTESGTVGGFGKAKELLLLPWMRWGIETQDMRVSGHGVLPLTDPFVQIAPMRVGTRLVVQMAADEHTTAATAIAFISKCYLPGIDFRVRDGQEPVLKVAAKLKVGELARELPGANVYYEKKQRLDAPVMLIRVNGIYMHDRWISSDVKGTIVVELTGRSTDLLAANRDSVRDYKLSRALDQYTNELAADVKSATRSKRLLRQKWEGTGKYEVRRRQAQALASLGSLEPSTRGKLAEQQIEQLGEILAEVAGARGGEEREEDAPLILTAATGTLEACADLALLGSRQVETLVKLLTSEPDFYVINESEDFRVPKRFLPENMAPGLRKLAKFWAELCRFVLIQLNYDGQFGVGWIFDPETLAVYQAEVGEHWLLLNPFRDGKLGAETFSLSEAEDVNWLYAAAVHEATHMADGITNHNESFAAALTRNVARTANRGKQIEKIRKAVVARGARKSEEADKRRPALDAQRDLRRRRLNDWLFRQDKQFGPASTTVLARFEEDSNLEQVILVKRGHPGMQSIEPWLLTVHGVVELSSGHPEWMRALQRITQLHDEYEP